LELLAEAAVIKPERISALQRETGELTAIFVTCAKKTRSRKDEV
jgi:hypothetical protein